MSGWCDLPRELLEAIVENLESPFDHLSFRSVCSSWRRASAPSHRHPSFHSKLHLVDKISPRCGGLVLRRRRVLRLGLPESPSSVGSGNWLIKVEQGPRQAMRLLNPLSGCRLLPPDLALVLDLSVARISQVHEEFVLEGEIDGRPSPLCMSKVAVSSDACGTFVILAVLSCGSLFVYGAGDQGWPMIREFPSGHDHDQKWMGGPQTLYDDVLFFQGRFYAVDRMGRLIVVEVVPSPSLKYRAPPLFGGVLKCLLECDSDLLRVDMFLGSGMGEVGCHGRRDFLNERKVRFEVHKLSPVECEWIKVDDLRDWMLFLGKNCDFSIRASDFSGCKGNTIYFTDYCFSRASWWHILPGEVLPCRIRVYNMEDGSLCDISDCHH